MRRHTILSVVSGSRAYGLDVAGSDTDRRGVFAAPTALYWRFDKPPTHADGPREEEFSWEVERFCELALGANPTVLECLWSPIVEKITPDGEELLAIRDAFVSRHAHRTFLAYAEAQFRRLRGFTSARDRKHAMHLLRLLLSGTHLLEHGEPLVRVGEHRDRLNAVRHGETPWEEVLAWRAELTAGLDRRLAGSPLPEEPDRDRVERFLIALRRRRVDVEL
ncbi:nucleotidyltransferase [Bailinhaonella thermotolerans]|uniref:Nucleotidyltransferase n=1 Tax=Bailinhaonella thermotolerans TaxID=1070861 RepID=A0A3A4B1E0_9ACTN|nr:nucleotidyltransferase [Bailinhaonella thermotolerans]